MRLFRRVPRLTTSESESVPATKNMKMHKISPKSTSNHSPQNSKLPTFLLAKPLFHLHYNIIYLRFFFLFPVIASRPLISTFSCLSGSSLLLPFSAFHSVSSLPIFLLPPNPFPLSPPHIFNELEPLLRPSSPKSTSRRHGYCP